MFFRLAEQKETTLLKTLTLFLSAAIKRAAFGAPFRLGVSREFHCHGDLIE